MEYKPAPLLHHPKMMAQMHQMHQHQEMKFHPHIAQFNNPQFLFKSPPDHPSAFHSLANHQEQQGKSVSWQEDGNFYADSGKIAVTIQAFTKNSYSSLLYILLDTSSTKEVQKK